MQITISNEFGEKLKQIANKKRYKTYDKPSATKLIEAIANGSCRLIKDEDILLIMTILSNNCKYADMEIVAKILDYQIPESSIISIIKQKIAVRQSFRLSYIDPSGKHESFDCIHAQIKRYENREYLEVAFSNNVESDSILGLEKNRIFRIDRITDATQILDINHEWGELNYINVTYELYGNLAASYQPKRGETLETFEGGIRITSQISNEFFFIRKLVRYLDSARILEPKELAIKLRDSLEQIASKYQWLD